MRYYKINFASLLALFCISVDDLTFAESIISLETRVSRLEERVAELERHGLGRVYVLTPAATTPVPYPTDLTGLLSTMRAVPYFKEGKSIGLRLFAIKANSYWDNAGLKNGDILLEINGKSISDNEHLIAGLGDINKNRKSETSFKLERNREEMTIKYKEP